MSDEHAPSADEILAEIELSQLSPDAQRAIMARDVRDLKRELKDLRSEMKDIKDLFTGAQQVVKWVKLLGGFVIGLGAIWAIISPYLPHFNKHHP